MTYVTYSFFKKPVLPNAEGQKVMALKDHSAMLSSTIVGDRQVTIQAGNIGEFVREINDVTINVKIGNRVYVTFRNKWCKFV